jgi:hypothetical protein
MDQYCMSCHNGGGAPDAVAALTGVPDVDPTRPRTATNPFGDAISNDYDQLSRGAVVNAFSQFDTGNSSHHAVRGARYTATTLTAAQFTNISTANMTAYPSAVKNVRSITGTISSTGHFATTYTPLGTNTTLTDASVIHCGDCHTVGQFKPNYASNSDGTFVNPAIGAHGSNNEYLLRKANGSENTANTTAAVYAGKDALVCYLCHALSQYGTTTAHDGVSTSSNRCNNTNNNTAGGIGAANRINVNGNIVNGVSNAGTFATFTSQVHKGNYSAGGGTIFGIMCANCHNSSDNKTFGGIHGNANNATYTSYSSAMVTGAQTLVPVSRKPYRFLPGLGNFRYNGGNSPNEWTWKTLGSTSRLGCYTLNGRSTSGIVPSSAPTKAKMAGTNVPASAVADDNGILGSWGACTDHAGSSMTGVSDAPGRTLLRPLTY